MGQISRKIITYLGYWNSTFNSAALVIIFNEIAKPHLNLVCCKKCYAVTIYYELVRDRWYYTDVHITLTFQIKICAALAPFCLIISKP